MRIINQTRNVTLLDKARVADNFWSRLRGLLGVSSLAEGEGLVLVGEKSIHMLFMKIPLDIIYVDKTLQVIRLDIDLKPYRLGPFLKNSAYIIEMSVGVIKSSNTQVGDQLKFEPEL